MPLVSKLVSYLCVYVLGMISLTWVPGGSDVIRQQMNTNPLVQDSIGDARNDSQLPEYRQNTGSSHPDSPDHEHIRVLCWIMTSKESLKGKSIHVKNTWTKRCDKVLFMSDSDDPNFPAIGLNTTEGRDHLTAKTMRAFQYIYEHHLDDADWFMKADDNTYVILENLRYFLSSQSTTEPIYFGRPYRFLKGYHSGGAGYVLSKEALKRFGNRKKSLCKKDGGPEDVYISYCLRKLGVTLGEARDNKGRTRFHVFSPRQINSGDFTERYHESDAYGGPVGINTTSPYTISFHNISQENMHLMEYFVYQLRPYGVTFKTEDLNV